MRLYLSSAHRWVPCPGSVQLIEAIGLADDDRTDADEGVQAHAVAVEYLISKTVELSATVTQEMIEGAVMYVNDVLATQRETGAHVHIESKIMAPSIHKENGGRIDSWIWDHANNTIYVWDYKFGFTLVDVFGNWQLIDSVAAILDNVNHNGNPTVVMTIVQPRGFHRDGPVRVWSTNVDELRVYLDQMRVSADMAITGGALCHAGPHCYKCPAAHGCETLQRANLRIMDLAYSSMSLQLPDEHLGRELSMLKSAETFIKARIQGLELDAMHRIRAGKRVPGYCVAPGRKSERWTKPPEEVAMMGDLMGVELRKPLAVITPNQARTANIPAELVASYAETIPGALRLTAETGKLTRIFGK